MDTIVIDGQEFDVVTFKGHPIGTTAKKKMPKQKPGQSEQVVCTPDNFLAAVKQRLGIQQFTWDLAATRKNSVCGPEWCYTEQDNALVQPWNLLRNVITREPDGDHGDILRTTTERQWNWCNPPFSNLRAWVFKAWRESEDFGACTAMLVPASVGANWWKDYVEGKAYVTFLNGRLTFKGHDKPYPKDMALLLYAPYLQGGSCVWRWK